MRAGPSHKDKIISHCSSTSEQKPALYKRFTHFYRLINTTPGNTAQRTQSNNENSPTSRNTNQLEREENQIQIRLRKEK